MASAVARVADQFSDQLWRLNNLYWITDKNGKLVKFKLNDAQAELYWDLWWRTGILKARQFGFSTFLCLYALDSALFNDFFAAGVIAHTLPDAKRLFETKVLFPYERMPEGVRAMRPASRDRVDEIKFSNHSSVTVSTSFRSGTLKWLHVSEMGKIAAKHPEKAIEIVTGAFEAVGKNGMIVVESTAEGRAGPYYDLIQRAMADQRAGKKLSNLDFRFFFMPWWRAREYRLPHDGGNFPDRMTEYFASLESGHGIHLDDEQKTWYVTKERALSELMWREYPSTPEEAFKAAIEGAYFSRELAEARHQQRITQVPMLPDVPVETWWDIGHDTTAIWLTQTVGMYCHVVGYFQDAGQKLSRYKRWLDDFALKHHLTYGLHHWPHDMGNEVDWSDDQHRTRKQKAEEMGMRGEVHQRMAAKEDGIEAARNFMAYCVFDEARCDEGLKGLESYRKEWDEKRCDWRNTPVHDWASHPADAFQQLSLYHRFPQEMLTRAKARQVKTVSGRGWT